MGTGRREAPIAVGAGGAKGHRGAVRGHKGTVFPAAAALKPEGIGHLRGGGCPQQQNRPRQRLKGGQRGDVRQFDAIEGQPGLPFQLP